MIEDGRTIEEISQAICRKCDNKKCKDRDEGLKEEKNENHKP